MPHLFAFFALFVKAEAEHKLIYCDRNELEYVLGAHVVTMLLQCLVELYDIETANS